MEEEQKKVVRRRIFDSYIAAVENSIGSYMFKNFYVDIDGVKKDAMEDGWLSCAFYASAVLHMFGYIKSIHGTVQATVKDLKEEGWTEIPEPVLGSVIVWKPGENTNGHSHIGFYMGGEQAVSNDSWKKHPLKDDWKFNGKREIEMILWKEGLQNA